MNTTQNKSTTSPPASRILHPRAAILSVGAASRAAQSRPRLGRPTARGFTLVELLVVITIISILAALITVAAVGALRAMDRARIKADINEISSGLDEVKNKTTAYPPNCQTDDQVLTGTDAAATPLDEAGIVNDLKRYLKAVAPRSQESDSLALALTGQKISDPNYPAPNNPLRGGIAASEAVVFWLGGFSSDPKYPISGEGGPSYAIPTLGAATNAQLDPIESRTWIYPFDVTRLGPRDSNGYFNGRCIEYTAPNGTLRRINFWTYTPAKSDQPYLYFDTSRHPVGDVVGSNLQGTYDPPALSPLAGSGDLNSVFAFKKVAETSGTGTPQVQFINPDKFQVFHCGIDNAWDAAAFARMGAKTTPLPANANDASKYLLFPSGPFVGEFADTEVNFAVESTIEDAMK